MIDDYVNQTDSYEGLSRGFDEPLLPTHYEVRFGPRRRNIDAGDEGDPRDTDTPFRLELAPGQAILVEGRIDRIDVGRIGERRVFAVIDYKTGAYGPSKTLNLDNIAGGSQLQVALYALAAERHLFQGEGAACLYADYWWLKEKGYLATDGKSGLSLHEHGQGVVTLSEAGESLVTALKGRLRGILAALRGGAVPRLQSGRAMRPTLRPEYDLPD